MPSERMQRQINRLLDEAEQATAERNWAIVRERAEEALTLDAGNADARSLLDLAELRLERSAGSGQQAAGDGTTGFPLSRAGEGQGEGEPRVAAGDRAEALRHLDIAIAELREMKMQPALERALRHKELLGA